jgi:HPP family protein
MRKSLAPAAAAGLVMAVIGVLAWATGVPWLFPSLGPTIAIQAEASDSPVARPWNVVIGHFIGAAVGFAAVRVSGVIHEAPVNLSHLITPARAAAAAGAVLVSMALQALARANHPPAQATTLLVVVGALDADAHGALVLAAGVLLVALLGEPVRRSALGLRRSD